MGGVVVTGLILLSSDLYLLPELIRTQVSVLIPDLVTY